MNARSGENSMSEANIKAFQKKIHVRPIRMEDYDQIVALQLKCFPGMKPWTKEQFESQQSIFPEGQICVEYHGTIVASSSSLILDFAMYGDQHSWKAISDSGFITNHNPEGNTLYGIEIMVSPDYRGMKLARRLYDARKQLAFEKNLMRIVLGGRIPGYGKHASKMSAREYVEKVIQKVIVDPVLTTQLSNGFVLKRLIGSYLDSDLESKGYATLLEWANLDFRPDPDRVFVAAHPVRICVVQYEMRKINSFEEFVQQCEFFIDVASDYRCDFILFPEIYTTQMLSFIEAPRPALAVRKLSEYTPRYVERFTQLAVRYNINIIGGSHFCVENDRLYNVAFLFQRNGTINKQYKLHITPNEKKWWGVDGGTAIDVFDTDKGKISIQICYDIEFPEVSRIAVEKGAQIIFVPFCTDERYGYLRVRYSAQARCIENHVYVAIAGTVGNLPSSHNMDIQYAQSGIFTPADFQFARDAVEAECTPNIETVIIDEVDLELLKRHRQSGSVLNWRDRRVDIYETRLRPDEE